jgi:hypothetical protein
VIGTLLPNLNAGFVSSSNTTSGAGLSPPPHHCKLPDPPRRSVEDEDAGALESSDEEFPPCGSIEEHLQALNINPSHFRYAGKSSAEALIRTALELRSDVDGAPAPNDAALWSQVQARRPEFWQRYDVRLV